jgi:hypothetical protein
VTPKITQIANYIEREGREGERERGEREREERERERNHSIYCISNVL